MIDKDFALSFMGLLPAVRTVKLLPRAGQGASADTFATGIPFTARKRPISKDEMQQFAGILLRTSVIFSVVVESQATLPKPGDVIRDEDGTRYLIDVADLKIVESMSTCLCHPEVS